MTKKDDKHRRNNKRGNSSSDSESESYSDDNELDIYEYNKLLAKRFPSKYMDKKIKSMEKEFKTKSNKKSKSKISTEAYTQAKQTSELKSKKKESKKKHSKQSKKKYVKESSSSDSYEDNGYSSEDEYELDSEEESALDSGKFNIIFTIGEPSKSKYESDAEYDTEEEFDSETDDSSESDDDKQEQERESEDSEHDTSDESESETSNTDSDSDSDSDSDYIPEETSASISDSSNVENITDEEKDKELNSKAKKKIKRIESKDEDITDLDNDDIYKKFKELSNKLLEHDTKNKNKNKNLKSYIKNIERCNSKNKKKQKKSQKKNKKKNLEKFRKQLRQKNVMNDYLFFRKLPIVKQNQIINEVDEINKLTQIEKPYRLALLESSIPSNIKAEAFKKISSLRYMDQENGEYYKLKNWVDTFMRIPFGIYSTLPVCMGDGVEKCHEFIEDSKRILDEAVYGLDDAKLQIIQLIGQWMVNPNAIGTAIAIHGPPGTGKTSLVKEGISKILNRAFAFSALGGTGDASHFEGHNYTYEGSTYGRIIGMLIQSRMMNPIIYFDELDKLSNSPKGDEVTGILTHLTDTTQNSEFHDKYFAEISFDLSKVLFIFSYNDESAINPILKDRMYRIQTKGYGKKEKITIALDYLLPKIREQIKFNEDDIIIPDGMIGYIIENYTDSEKGVRSLKRCLEVLYTKLNLYRLMKPGSDIFKKDMNIAIEFPVTITKEIIDVFIKKNTEDNPYISTMYT
jgi:ATP-dependent Lon protease